jgi:hypothetical protein
MIQFGRADVFLTAEPLLQAFILGIAGNLISALLIAAVSALALIFVFNRRQREIASFFGLNSRVREVQILLSRYLPEVQEESLDSGAASVGWVRETVAVDEFRGAQALARLFESNWIVASLASVISSSLLGGRDTGSVRVFVTPAPEPPTRPRGATIVLMGTGARESNELAEEFLGMDTEYSVFKFVKDDNGRAFERRAEGFTKEIFYASNYAPGELAVLQRATMPDGQVTFLCAGKDAPGSRLAAELLATTWRTLHEEYNGRHHGDFALLYVFYPGRAPQILSNWP